VIHRPDRILVGPATGGTVNFSNTMTVVFYAVMK
jgi:hypothetical protein